MKSASSPLIVLLLTATLAAWAKRMLELRASPRWELAIADADLTFPAAADSFSCALGIPVNEQDTPALYRLLRRSLTDIGLAT